MHILTCLKWVATRPEIDPLTGTVTTDSRFSGASEADLSALEWSLRLADALNGTVSVATVGPVESETLLRDGLAVGARSALRVDGPSHRASRAVAAELAAVAVAEGADLVCCGTYSLDRGSGSVPAFIAGILNWPQALGLVSAGTRADGILTERRLDHGRRERLLLEDSAVLSFEAGPELRRASLASTLAAGTATVAVREAIADDPAGPTLIASGPYRPRPKVKPAPQGDTRDRIANLIGADVQRTSSQPRELDPTDAAKVAVDQLSEWGYLDAEPGLEPGRPPAS